MTFDELTFDEFLNRATFGKTKETQRVYTIHLKSWMEFCGDRGVNYLNPTKEIVYDFLQTIPNLKTRESVKSILHATFTALAVSSMSPQFLNMANEIKITPLTLGDDID